MLFVKKPEGLFRESEGFLIPESFFQRVLASENGAASLTHLPVDAFVMETRISDGKVSD